MTVAETRHGKVRGAEIADGVLGWRGIPYARPPVGALRFRPPEPPQPWGGARDAMEYGNRPLQGELGPAAPDAPPTGEDCLYLNVTAPAGVSGRPVLFWLHGGGYEMGDGSQAAGDGAAFARSHGVVVVTTNYRLGALGFLDVPGESPTGAAGLHDQIAALRWTRENIAAFGGDPDQITVYGLSAGGKSVTNLLASPLASGLIARAAESSGGGAHRAVPARARRHRRAAPIGACGGHPQRPARRGRHAALDLDLAAIGRRRRPDRQPAGRDRGRLGGRGAVAAADLRPRVRHVRAARPGRPGPGGPGAGRVLRSRDSGPAVGRLRRRLPRPRK
jgi:carboxylesterase type B